MKAFKISLLLIPIAILGIFRLSHIPVSQNNPSPPPDRLEERLQQFFKTRKLTPLVA
ncbi:MAG: hypothetical protein AAGC74_00800 [Verrucomicrobiota bacterium]